MKPTIKLMIDFIDSHNTKGNLGIMYRNLGEDIRKTLREICKRYKN